MRTYITLFSCAGVGCHGFDMNGFRCIATNELLAPRLDVQRANHKCQYDSGYIIGDATAEATHQRIREEIERRRENEGVQQVDVVFATPPCQGMSTANYKKNDHEQVRNSLVVEAIKLINDIHPKIFVFENVRAFMKSICTDISGEDMTIKDSIYHNLSERYNIYWKVINFKDYGVPSSRPRTLVIGTSRQLLRVTPLHLFPTRQKEILLRDSIGSFPRLGYCEKDPNDPLHFARPFPEYMLEWIKDLKEGETAFDNPDETKPYSIDEQGNKVINKGAYMGNKYRRLIWNRPGACVATRNDIMSSQDTIHPCDNRVLSIRELMTLMTIPDDFKWTDHDEGLTIENSDDYLKENEGNIRRCIGEAVPTRIGYEIANKIAIMLDYERYAEGLPTERPAESNFYIQAQESLHIPLLPQSAFENILLLNPLTENVTVRLNSAADFMLYVPQLCSYLSQSNSIDIEVVDLDENERDQLKALLTLMPLGSNVNIAFKERIVGYKYYNIVIENGQCRQPAARKQLANAATGDMEFIFA